jgi:hypothetical protein
MKIPIAIVDDNTQSRLFLAEQIGYSDEIAIIFTAKNGIDFLEQMKGLPHSRYPSVDGYRNARNERHGGS